MARAKHGSAILVQDLEGSDVRLPTLQQVRAWQVRIMVRLALENAALPKMHLQSQPGDLHWASFCQVCTLQIGDSWPSNTR